MSVSISYSLISNHKYIEGGNQLWGILNEEYGNDFILSMDDINFLKGILACGHEGVRELIDAICENDEIRVSNQY